ncbi:MAG: protein kinase [Planctomycetota bacterium]|nr:protein kinase [Planctomycetota bacterium]
MDRDQQQGHRAIELGFVSPEQVRLAYQSPRRSQSHDLCALLLEHGLLSGAQAQAIRAFPSAPGSPNSGDGSFGQLEMNPTGSSDASDSLTATYQLPGDQAKHVSGRQGPHNTPFQSSAGSQAKQQNLHSPKNLLEDEQSRRRAAIVKAYEQERLTDPLFAPHADGVLERKEQLGVGGMGEVYRVFDKRLGRQAALKILLQDQGGRERLSRFQREGRITARLEHPAIPPIYEAGTNCAGQHYLLMKVIEGQSLEERIRQLYRNAPPSFEELRPLLEALIPVCEAVAYAHNQDIIHRDLKPDNIMLGEFSEVMVMDWGIARDLKDDDDGALEDSDAFEVGDSELAREGLTLEGAVIGTPGYMSPEQANGQGVTQQADVFALGAILTAILTGSSPIRGESPFKLIVSTIKGSIESPRDRDATIPKALDAIARKALAPKLSERFTSVEEIGKELKAYLAGREVSVYKYSLSERLATQLKRRPGLFMGLFAGTLMLSISGLLGVQTYNTQLREADAKRLKITFGERLKRVETSQRNFRLALDLARKGVGREALRERIRQALENSDRDLDNLLFAARIYEEGKLYSEAKELLNEAAEKFPPAYQALYSIHRLTIREDMGTGFTATPALKRLMELARANGESNEYTLLFDGIEKHKEGKYQDAITIFDKIQSTKQNHKMMFTFRGLSYLMLKRFENAFSDLNLALSYDPLDAKAFHYRGLCYEQCKDFKKAFDDYSRSLELNRDQVHVYVRRALIWDGPKKFDNALRDLEKAISLDPKNPEHYRKKAALLITNGRASTAIPCFDRMLELSPDNAVYLDLRAKNSIICSNFDQAKEDLARIIELNPENAEAFLSRGSLYAVLKSVDAKDKAIRDLSRAIELKGRNTPAYFARAQVYAALGKYGMALIDWNLVIDIDAKNYSAYFARAEVHASLNNNKECMADLKFLYRKAPPGHPARKNAVNVLLKMGDPEVVADLQKKMKAMKKLGANFGKKSGSEKR